MRKYRFVSVAKTKKRYFRYIILTLFLLLIVWKNGIRSMIISSFPPISKEFNILNTELGILVSIFHFTSFIGSFIWFFLYDKIKPHYLLLMGGLTSFFGLILFNLGVNLFYTEILVSIVGLGIEVIPIILLNRIIDLFGEKSKGKGISIYVLANGFGGVFGTFLTGLNEGIFGIDWKMFFGVYGLSGLFVIIVISFVLMKIEPNNEPTPTSEDLEEIPLEISLYMSKVSISRENLVKIFIIPQNLILFIIAVIMVPMTSFNNVWLQKYWIDFHTLNQSTASISFIFTSGAEFLGVFFSGLIYDHIKETRKNPNYKSINLGISFSFLSIPFFTVGLYLYWTLSMQGTEDMNFIELCYFMFIAALTHPNMFVSYTSLFMGFISSQIFGTLVIILLERLNTKEMKIMAINILIIIINMGNFIGPVLGGYLGDTIGIQNTLMIQIPVYAAIGVLFMILKKYIKE